MREYDVAVRVRSWSGAERGEDLKAECITPITEAGGRPPRVRWLSNEQLALGGYPAGTVEVGPITPGNTLRSSLEPKSEGNDEIEWILTGPAFPCGGAFSLKDIRDDRGYQFKVVLTKVGDSA